MGFLTSKNILTSWIILSICSVGSHWRYSHHDLQAESRVARIRAVSVNPKSLGKLYDGKHGPFISRTASIAVFRRVSMHVLLLIDGATPTMVNQSFSQMSCWRGLPGDRWRLVGQTSPNSSASLGLRPRHSEAEETTMLKNLIPSQYL